MLALFSLGNGGHPQLGAEGSDVEQAEPPQIVFVEPAPCPDTRAAQDLLTRALAPSVAPRASWTVTVRVRKDKSGLTAEGEIADDVGAPVAHRSIAKDTHECGGLVRAVGVWASLVLDEEVRRANAPPSPAPAVGPTTAWPAPAPPPPPPEPEQALFLKNPEAKRTFEIGVAASYMNGVLGDSGAAIGAVHAFVVVEVPGGWFLRPMIGTGRSIKDVAIVTDTSATWAASRIDACRRMPGNYLEHRGIQMDLCGGIEAGLLHFDSGADPIKEQTVPLVAPGGTLGLRGELASALSAEIRGMVGVNLLRDTFLVTQYDQREAPQIVYARLELGFTWRLR